MGCDHRLQLGFAQGWVRRERLEHFGVAVAGELIDDVGWQVVPLGEQHPHGGNRRSGKLASLGGRGRRDTWQQGGANLRCRGQAGQDVEGDRRVVSEATPLRRQCRQPWRG